MIRLKDFDQCNLDRRMQWIVITGCWLEIQRKYKETITIKLIALDSLGVNKMIREEINWKGWELLSNDQQTLHVP